MAGTRFKTIDEYVASQPKGAQTALKRARGSIRRAMPGAEEVISYGIPAFKFGGRTVLYLAGWKDHYSLYPASRQLELKFKKELAPYELSHKGTIRFPFSEPVPERLIEAIAKFRVKESAERAKAKVTSTTTTSRSARRR